MTIALHTPYDETSAVDLGRHLFRKQVLKVGEIDYKGRKINFSRDYLAKLAESFRARAFDQVPFMLAGSDNAHTLDPERYRGEVKGLELADDGLYATVETTDAGAEVIRANPKLGVSARIIEGLTHADGRSFPQAVQHVLGTLDPRVTGMKPWEAVSLSVPSDVEVIDLTSQEPPMEITPEQRAAFDAYLTELAALAPATEPSGDDAPEMTPEQLADLEAFLASVQAEGEPEPAGASLSETERAEIALARSQAEAAHAETARMRSELNVARFERERTELVAQGIPPAAVDLAMPLLLGEPGSASIELSNGTTVDPGAIVRELLAQMKDTVDLSAATVPAPGRPVGDAEKDILERWAAQHPQV